MRCHMERIRLLPDFAATRMRVSTLQSCHKGMASNPRARLVSPRNGCASSTPHDSLCSNADTCMTGHHECMTRYTPNFRGYVKLSFASRHYVSRLNGCHTWQQCLMVSDACVEAKLHSRLEIPLFRVSQKIAAHRCHQRFLEPSKACL